MFLHISDGPDPGVAQFRIARMHIQIPLEDLRQVHGWESIVGDPVRHGLPATRIRRLTLGVKKGVARMVRPFSDVSMMHRKVEMDGDSYFTEPDCDILQYKEHLDVNALLPATSSWEDLIGVSRRRRVLQYRDLAKTVKLQSAHKCRILNVDQKPLDVPMVSDYLPCQLRHCNLWSEVKRRLLTPKSHLAVSLVPMWPNLAESAGCSWPLFTHVPTYSQMGSMSGNAQNLCFIGSHIQLIFCHLRLHSIEEFVNKQGLNSVPAPYELDNEAIEGDIRDALLRRNLAYPNSCSSTILSQDHCVA
jgi:hypothetical protein